MRFFTFLLNFVVIICINAQDTIKKKNKHPVDTNYIYDISDEFTLYFSIYGKSNDLSIYDGVKRKTLTYSPNTVASFGPGFSYKWIGLDLSFFSLGINDDTLYGNTDIFDIQSHFYLKRFLIDFNLQYYKGFYLNTTGYSNLDLAFNNKRIIRPDIFQLGTGFSVMYVTNYKECSMRATFSQSQIQKKSAGTWAFGLYYNLFGAAGDSGFIQESYRQYYDSSSYISGVISSNLGIIGGYFHTFIIKKKWFITLSALPGISSNRITYALLTDTAVRKERRPSGRFQSRLGAGYNYNKIYFGISIVNDIFDFKNSTKSFIKQQFGVLRMYFGYRFIPKSPKNEKN